MPLKLTTSPVATPRTVPESMVTRVGSLKDGCAALIPADAIASQTSRLDPRILHMTASSPTDNAEEKRTKAHEAAGSTPNTAAHLLPKAGATQERTLPVVGSIPLVSSAHFI